VTKFGERIWKTCANFGKTVVMRNQQILSRDKKQWKIWKNCCEEWLINAFPDKKWKIWKHCCEEKSAKYFPGQKNGNFGKTGMRRDQLILSRTKMENLEKLLWGEINKYFPEKKGKFGKTVVRRDQQILSRTKNGKFGKTVVRRGQQIPSRTKYGKSGKTVVRRD